MESSTQFRIMVLASLFFRPAVAVFGQDAGLAFRPGQEKLNAIDGQKYVWIPGGRFTMGCSPGDNECDDEEKPAHEVEITNGFWLGQTPVTVGAWERYRLATKKGPLPHPGPVTHKSNQVIDEPAVAMTWKQASEFCKWADGRLPTEAEWEYSARAGIPNSRYAEIDSIAWFGDNSGKDRIDSKELFQREPTKYSKRLLDNGNGQHAVAQKQPNAWNLYDMLGNVWQWTADWYDPGYYARSRNPDPQGPKNGENHTLRGGSWMSNPKNIRASFRGGFEPVYNYGYFGVRCVGH